MIKRGTVKEQLTVDSVSRKMAGLCPLMAEEVSLLITVLYVCSLNLDATFSCLLIPGKLVLCYALRQENSHRRNLRLTKYKQPNKRKLDDNFPLPCGPLPSEYEFHVLLLSIIVCTNPIIMKTKLKAKKFKERKVN